LNELNRLSLLEAQERLFACFASRKWARLVAEGRPYENLDDLFVGAERAWSALEPGDWSEALDGHPRIGERGGSSPAASEREQRGVRTADEKVLAELVEENRHYEARFGHVFLIAAAGRDADDVLAAMRKRMGNDPVTEAQVAAAEHRKIARLRMVALFQS
jgi:2-oxo-4-hydroxy-4-carboxy-5-ureidoimidazoline decarboxylase